MNNISLDWLDWLAEVRKKAVKHGEKKTNNQAASEDAADQLYNIYLDRVLEGKIKQKFGQKYWEGEYERILFGKSLKEESTDPVQIVQVSNSRVNITTKKADIDNIWSSHEKAKDLLFDVGKNILKEEQRERYLAYLKTGVKSPINSASAARQTIHDSVKRAETTVLAAMLNYLAKSSSPDSYKAFFTPSIGGKGILSASMMKRYDLLDRQVFHKDKEELKTNYENLWEESLRHLCQIACPEDRFRQNDVQVLCVCFMTFICIARTYGSEFRAIWKDTWDELGKLGILNNPHTLRQLATAGGYVGEDYYLIDFLRKNNDLELAQIFLYANGGVTSKLPYLNIANGTHNEIIKNINNKYSKELTTYINYCLINDRYNNDGLTLMTLKWIDGLIRQKSTCASNLLSIKNTIIKQDKKITNVCSEETKKYYDSIIKNISIRIQHD